MTQRQGDATWWKHERARVEGMLKEKTDGINDLLRSVPANTTLPFEGIVGGFADTAKRIDEALPDGPQKFGVMLNLVECEEDVIKTMLDAASQVPPSGGTAQG